MSVRRTQATQPASARIRAPRSIEDACFSLIESTFIDVDDQSAGLKYWEQNYEQLSAGLFEGVVEELFFDDVQLFRERATQVIHQTGSPWEGSLTVGVPIETRGQGVLNGTLMDVDTLFAFGSDSFDFRTPSYFDSVAVTLDAKALEGFAGDVWHLDIKDGLGREGAFRCPPDVAARLREFLVLLLGSLSRYPKMLNHLHVRRALKQEIYNSVVLAIRDTNDTTTSSVTWSRAAIVQKARNYVFARRQEPIIIADLCTALNVSRRTLQYSFQAVLNTNPVAYLRAIRLNGVRRALRAARGDPAECVADIAASWGFWHLSHFAVDYRKMFGELPSHTLRGGQRGAKESPEGSAF